ncbi:hypothetical protein RE428_41580 [Marinobacter nanhaiticus D15-8W]|uniref:Uncharacterized protein n=1 Tax=Marinobacter nanhaiticus D15-8W TaxID=626887 RepID=N6WY27_9GAMM|nr:hypothetical protein J057_11636 [Marinobacter nanhaiticus D15-8W]BES73140.1 hypothetical protein RE428_41580 [Marinobacter nanhaiticus D15-8W]
MISGEAQYFRSAYPLLPREQVRVGHGYSEAPLKASIPARYRDGQGGIDLEQVKRDQRRARSDVIRTVIGRLSRLGGSRG